MSKKHTYYWLLPLVMAFFSCTKKTELSLEETFSYKDKKPFGTWVLHHHLGQLFHKSSIEPQTQKFNSVYEAIEDTASLYVCVSKNYYAGRKDIDALLNFMYDGNDVFISAENIDRHLLDTLGITLRGSGLYPEVDFKSFTNTAVRLQPERFDARKAFIYYYEPFNNYFARFDSSTTRVLGTNDYGKPNFLVLFWGKSRLYLHCEPRALGNYFLLQQKNYTYPQHLFSYVSKTPERILWDDYYNKRHYPVNDDNSSGLAVLFKYPALANAFWLLLLLVVLYVLFEGKRRQRIVPVIPPNENTTVAFTETVSRLYLQKNNNRNIADKIILYFLEHIRSRYYLNTGNLDENFTELLSRKSGVSKEETEKTMRIIEAVQQEAYVTDHQLLILNHQTEKFYKKQS
ncbi:MAG TPA: hypothetical protein PKC39_10375 [Ferruginibacter sp.]|nr:hypothetical protein [Ferruginibacter sp.]HMP21355.1 hypothetical protein [Ferruginibacter sp.]